MKPLRLLALIEATTITGPARNLLEFARCSAAAGIETTVATFVRGEADNLFTRTTRAQGTRLETVPESGAWDSAVPERLRALVARVQPHVIQSHAVKGHFLVRRSGIPDHCPWVAFHHGYTWPTAKARLYNQLDRWSLGFGDGPRQVLTVSLPFRDQLVAIGVSPKRIEVIHNAIEGGWGRPEPHEAANLRLALGIAPEKRVILIVGRLSREKDHLTLLEAMKALPQSLNAHLVVDGEGPERPRIEARLQALNMSQQVTLAGQRDSARPFYGIADIAVLSSLSEGSPNALLEAMSAGVPAVATKVGGVPEIAEDGQSALLVNPSNAGDMKAAIERILSDPALAARLVARSEVLIAEKYVPEARVTRLAAIYRRVAEGGSTIPANIVS